VLGVRDRREIFAVFEQRKAALDFVGLRKAPSVLFGEQQMAVGENVKLTAAAFGDLYFLAEAGFD
jgi:hypothetical protein